MRWPVVNSGVRNTPQTVKRNHGRLPPLQSLLIKKQRLGSAQHGGGRGIYEILLSVKAVTYDQNLYSHRSAPAAVFLPHPTPSENWLLTNTPQLFHKKYYQYIYIILSPECIHPRHRLHHHVCIIVRRRHKPSPPPPGPHTLQYANCLFTNTPSIQQKPLIINARYHRGYSLLFLRILSSGAIYTPDPMTDFHEKRKAQPDAQAHDQPKHMENAMVTVSRPYRVVPQFKSPQIKSLVAQQ